MEENKKEKQEKMNFYVDQDVCIGCGMCVAMCDNVFAFNDKGKSYVFKQPETEEEIKCAKDVVEGCCVSAVKMDELDDHKTEKIIDAEDSD